jgi:DNA-binding NarL/FixJ family response regulator
MSAGAAPVRVLVADDQKVVRDGLSLLIGMLPGVEVIGTAVDGTDAVRQAAACAPDVVLMDLSMPNCDGVEATRQIAGRQPGVQVVVLTAFADDDSVFSALRAGARGYLTKDAPARARSCRRCRRCARARPSWIRRCSAGWWKP